MRDTHTYTHTNTYAYNYSIHIYIYISIYKYIYLYVCIYIHIYIYMHIYLYTYIRLYTFLSNGSGKESGPNFHRASQHVFHLAQVFPDQIYHYLAADAMSIGSHVGLSLDLGHGSLRRVLGLLIDQEEQEVVVAIPTGIVETDCKDAVGDIAKAFVRVASSEVTENCSEWKKAAQFPVWPVVGSVLQAYYREEYEAKKVDTDSMLSAASVADAPRSGVTGRGGRAAMGRRTSPFPLGPPAPGLPEEGDEEED